MNQDEYIEELKQDLAAARALVKENSDHAVKLVEENHHLRASTVTATEAERVAGYRAGYKEGRDRVTKIVRELEERTNAFWRENDRLRSLLRDAEWDKEGECPWCRADICDGHEGTCPAFGDEGAA